MKLLDLFPTPPASPVEGVQGLACDSACARCELSKRPPRTVCIRADGEAGGLLIIGEAPGAQEDSIGRPFIGPSGMFLRALISEYWKGPVVYDNAVRCFPGREGDAEKGIDPCRPYLAQTLKEAGATRIICVGAVAAQSIAGVSISPLGTRRAYMMTNTARGPIPTFFVLHPAAALRNPIVERWFKEDLEWACTAKVTPEDLPWPGLNDIAAPPWSGLFRMVERLPDAIDAVRQISNSEWAYWDIESRGALWEPSFKILSVAICPKGSREPFVWGEHALHDSALRGQLVQWLQSPNAKKQAHNGKFDEQAVMSDFRVNVVGTIGDTRLGRKMLDAGLSARLDNMAWLVGMGGMKDENEIAKEEEIKRVRREMAKMRREHKAGRPYKPLLSHDSDPIFDKFIHDQIAQHGTDTKNVESWIYGLIPKPVLYRYNARDSVAGAMLGEQLEYRLAIEPEIESTYKEITMPLHAAWRQIEQWGIPVDRQHLELFDKSLKTREEDFFARLEAFAPGTNWNSPPQVRKIMFEDLGLPKIKQTDTGADSTDASVLEELKHHHALPGILIDYRSVVKMRGQYAGGMLVHVGADNRIHYDVLIDGAGTGRPSCHDPNLFNIPRPDDPDGKMARDSFCASPGFELFELDFSQIELVIAAGLSQDPKMIKIFKDGVDYHRRTAELIARTAWGIDPKDVTDKERSIAKQINFGLMYGMGDNELARRCKIKKHEATRAREAILGEFVIFARWLEDRVTESRATGYAWTVWNGRRARRRPIHKIMDRTDEGGRINAENAAKNTPIQGTAADYTAASLGVIVPWLLNNGLAVGGPPNERDQARVVVSVYDSILFESRPSVTPKVAKKAAEIMTSWNAYGLPLRVDMKRGQRWGSLEKTDLKELVKAA